jgi:hypothetical protein
MLVALDGRPEWLAFGAGAYYAAEPQLGRYTIPNRLHDAVAYGVPVAVVAMGWLVREFIRRRGGVGLEPVPVRVPVPVPVGTAVAGGPAGTAVPIGTAMAARSAFAAPITVTAAASAVAPVSAAAAAPVSAAAAAAAPVSAAAAAAASDEDSLPAGIGAFLPLGYP